jgi:hypothetical protein
MLEVSKEAENIVISVIKNAQWDSLAKKQKLLF